MRKVYPASGGLLKRLAKSWRVWPWRAGHEGRSVRQLEMVWHQNLRQYRQRTAPCHGGHAPRDFALPLYRRCTALNKKADDCNAAIGLFISVRMVTPTWPFLHAHTP